MDNIQNIENKEQLAIIVDTIIKGGDDSEQAHGYEDELHLQLIMQFCPDWVKEEVKRLRSASFPRWYA